MNPVTADLIWTKENVSEFIKFSSLKKTKKQRVMLPIFIACVALMLISGIIAFILTKMAAVIVMTVFVIAALGFYAVMFIFMMKSMAKKLLEANVENNGLTLYFGDAEIMVSRDGNPIGVISWEKIKEYSIGACALYIVTKTDSLLLVEHKNIKQGNIEDLITVLTEKGVKND